MTLYGFEPTAELDAVPKLRILDARLQPVDTPHDFGEVWRALEIGMREGEVLQQRNPYFKTIYNIVQLGVIHIQAEQRPEDLRPAQSDIDKFWEYGRIVSKLRGFVLLDEMA